jgi:diamine N-acetyltransferase
MKKLSAKNISLRAMEPADIELLYNIENNTDWWHLSSNVTPYSRFVLEQYLVNAQPDIYSARQLRLMINAHEASTPETVGAIDLYEFDPVNLRAGVGVVIATKWQNKGYASTALEILKNYAFDTLNLHQLYCGITTDNIHSIRLFENHGFLNMGIRKHWVRNENQWLDELMMQCLNPEILI